MDRLPAAGAGGSESYEIPESIDELANAMRQLTRSKLQRNNKLILLMSFQFIIGHVVKDPNAEMIAGVFKASNAYVKLRPHFSELLENCSRRYELVIYFWLNNTFAEDVLTALGDAARYFKGRVFTREHVDGDYNQIVQLIPHDARDLIVSFTNENCQYENVHRLPVSRHRFFNNDKHVLPEGFVKYNKEVLKRKFPKTDKDTEFIELERHLMNIHSACYSPTDGFQPNRIPDAVRQSKKAILRANLPENIPPSLSETVDKIKRLTRSKLVRENKLILLVDLDNTVINSTTDTYASRFKEGVVHKIPSFWVRIRPFAREFLREMSEKYEMIVVTFGSSIYAANIVNILDPDKTLFENRIISRNNIESESSKEEVLDHFHDNVKDMIVIIDDSDKVWRSTPNVYVPEYQYFYSNHTAFTPNLSYQIVKRECENKGQKVDLKSLKDDDNFLMTTCKDKLFGLHRMCYQDGQCRPDQMQEIMKDWKRERLRDLIEKRRRQKEEAESEAKRVCV